MALTPVDGPMEKPLLSPDTSGTNLTDTGSGQDQHPQNENTKSVKALFQEFDGAMDAGDEEVAEACIMDPYLQDMNIVQEQEDELRTVLHLAFDLDNQRLIKELIRSMKVDVLNRLVLVHDNSTKTVLHIACARGYKKIIKSMINRLSKESLKQLMLAQDICGRTALHVICEQGHVEIVPVLLNGLDKTILRELVIKKDLRKMTALLTACESCHSEVITALLNTLKKDKVLNQLILLGDGDDKTVLHWACVMGHQMVKSILGSLKEDIMNQLVMVPDKNNLTALHRSYEYGQTHSTSVIIDQLKQDILNRLLLMKDENDRTILHAACNRRDRDMVRRLLLQLRESIALPKILTQADRMGKTALYESCEHRDHQVAQMILSAAKKAKCMKEILCQSGDSPLIAAFVNGDAATVKSILDCAAMCECIKPALLNTNQKGQTIIHQACLHAKTTVTCIKPVLQATQKLGTNFTAELFRTRDVYGRTFIFYTSETTDEVMYMLMDAVHGEKDSDEMKECRIYQYLHDKDVQGKYAIHYAKQANKAYILREWLEQLDIDKPPHKFALYHDRRFQGHYNMNMNTNLLTILGKVGCLDLINHKYTQTYLAGCWRSYGRIFYITNLILYISMLLSLTIFVSTYKFHVGLVNGTIDRMNVTMRTETPQLTNVAQILLMVFTSLSILYEGFQSLAKGIYYWKTPENYADLGVSIGALAIAATSLRYEYNDLHHIFNTIIMCVAWINLAWMMTKIPSFSYNKGEEKNVSISFMFIMLFRVMKNVCIFLPVFALFILNFSLIFNSLLHTQEPFQHVGHSIMKTLAMTIGEVDFNTMFFPDNKAESPPFLIISCLFFVVFIFIMSISVMNLLVGMAVGDITQLQTEGEVRAFNSNVELILEAQALNAFFKRYRHPNDQWDGIKAHRRMSRVPTGTLVPAGTLKG